MARPTSRSSTTTAERVSDTPRRLPTNREPTHPGRMLAEEFVRPLGLSQIELARRLGVPVQRINLLIHGKRGVTADTALRLARLFGTTPEFWLHGQLAWDLHRARTGRSAQALRSIRPMEAARRG